MFYSYNSVSKFLHKMWFKDEVMMTWIITLCGCDRWVICHNVSLLWTTIFCKWCLLNIWGTFLSSWFCYRSIWFSVIGSFSKEGKCVCWENFNSNVSIWTIRFLLPLYHWSIMFIMPTRVWFTYISSRQSVFAISWGFHFYETSHMRSFAKIKPSRKDPFQIYSM